MIANEEFKVEVTEMIEHEDGSATVIFDTCERGRKALISYGLLKVLEVAASEALPDEEQEKAILDDTFSEDADKL